jgi:hypothetical protein
MALTHQRRKGDLSKVIKRGGTVSMIAFLLRALLDPDLGEAEKLRYERTLRHLTSKYSVVETAAVAKEEIDPFA